MRSRPAHLTTLTVALDVRERLILEDMKRATGLVTDADLARTALHFYASHLDVQGLTHGDFGLRRKRQNGR